MKRTIKILSSLILVCMLFFLTSCLAGMFEKELTITFLCDEEVIGTASITQFKNAKTPTLPDSFIPSGYKFYGWTVLNPDKVKATDENFKQEFVGPGKMIHYMDVAQYTSNTKIQMQALFINKNDIPKVYHYCIIAWYDKVATSGFDTNLIDKLQNALYQYLRSEGVSEDDIKTIVFRGYTGNVGPSCGAIMADEDVDIMLGWGSVDNVTTTGGMKEEMLLETQSIQVNYNGTTKNRTIHRLTDSETVLKVMEWLKSAECQALCME